MSSIIKGELPQIKFSPPDSKLYVESVSYHLPLHRVLTSFLYYTLPLISNGNDNSNLSGIEGLVTRVSAAGITMQQLAGYTMYPCILST